MKLDFVSSLASWFLRTWDPTLVTSAPFMDNLETATKRRSAKFTMLSTVSEFHSDHSMLIMPLMFISPSLFKHAKALMGTVDLGPWI
jgi:hypothetical protein